MYLTTHRPANPPGDHSSVRGRLRMLFEKSEAVQTMARWLTATARLECWDPEVEPEGQNCPTYDNTGSGCRCMVEPL